MASGGMRPWQKEYTDFIRAISAAYIFGIPLLFTMETWWIGAFADMWKLFAFVALAFLITIGTNYSIGFKQESTFNSVIVQSVNTLAVSVVAAFIVLLVLNQIIFDVPLESTLGKILVQMVPLSIGASLGNSILGSSSKSRGGTQHQKQSSSALKDTLRSIAVTVIGGIFIGFAIAPTTEIPLLASQLSFWHEIALIIFSVFISYMIVFLTDFNPQKSRKGSQGLLKNPWSETMVAYIVSLMVAFTALYLFDRIELSDPLHFAITQTLILGLPTTVGGAAGRIVV